MSAKEIEIHLFETKTINWSTDTLFAINDLNISVPENLASLEFNYNPYQLTLTKTADAAIITSNFDELLFKKHGEEFAINFYNELKAIYPIIGFDTFDTFDLGFTNSSVNVFDIIIKTQGIYNDFNKYKESNKYFSEQTYKNLRLSFPCFVCIHPTIRNRVRKAKQMSFSLRFSLQILDNISLWVSKLIPSLKSVFFIGGLTHINRGKIIASTNFPYDSEVSISFIPNELGFDDKQNILSTDSKIQHLISILRNKGVLINSKRINRFYFLLKLQFHKIIWAPRGYGEITFRHGEAISNKRLLLCEDLSNVKMYFDFKHLENVVFYPEKSIDLSSQINDIIKEKSLLQSISSKGYQLWESKTTDIDNLLRETVTNHIRTLIND